MKNGGGGGAGLGYEKLWQTLKLYVVKSDHSIKCAEGCGGNR